MRYRTEEHRGPAAFAALEPEWNDLVSRAVDTNASDMWPIMHGAWQVAQDYVVPRIFVVRDRDDRAVAILPLGATKAGYPPFTRTELLAIAPGLLDDNGLLLDEAHRDGVAPLIEAVLLQLTSEGCLTDVRPVPRVNLLAQTAEHLGSPLQARYIPPSRVAPLPPHPGTWQDVLHDAGARREIRRCQRRLNDKFGAAPTSATSADEVRRVVSRFVALHVREQALKGRLSKLASAMARQQFPNYIVDLHRRGDAEVIGITTPDGVLLAGYIFLRHRGRATGYRTAFNSDYRAFGPGTVALAAAIDRAIALGDHEWSFGCGGDLYKTRWAEPEAAYVRIIGVRRTPRRMVSRAWERGLDAWRGRPAYAAGDLPSGAE